MPRSKLMERKAAELYAERLRLAAQPPAPTPAEAPAPATLLERVLGERYGSGGGERVFTLSEGKALGPEVRQGPPAGFYRPAPGEFDCDCGCCAFCTRGLLPLPDPAPMPDAAPQTALDGPPALPLDTELQARLAAPPAPSQGLPPKGPGWAGLDAPFEVPTTYAGVCVHLMTVLADRDGEGAITESVAWRIRRAAHVLLYGREAGRPA